MSAEPVPGAFPGFPVEGLDFYDDMEADNTRAFFTRNRALYERSVRAPMLALLALLEPEFGPAKVFRPYRDLRYTNDPTPYKTHQGGFVAIGRSTGWYVQIDAAGLAVDAGLHDSSGPLLARFREAVDDEHSGRELEAVVARLTGQGFAIGGNRLKTRPRGVDADHPRIQLLRHRSLVAGRRYDDNPAWVHRPEAADRVRADWRALRPLVEWVGAHVSPPTDR